ncbi:MAG: SDR family NAD(P)-dependent oxidoreductase [Candidatus Aureabacteria bacterium]|nr:SDR family NAD(P)-dependent oxidoreductase [Candidatus Auribacterota bacterium]
MKEKFLVTGGAGFIGSNLVAGLVKRGARVIVYDNLSRRGTEKNLEWLRGVCGERMEFVRGDVCDPESLRAAVAPCQVICHLAAQVAVTTSVADPETDFRINAMGAFNVLEAARRGGRSPILILTSTNKVYGGMEDLAVREGKTRYRFAKKSAGVSEKRPLDFHSPYGCSKGAADQYVRDYSRIYGLPTVVFRMSCIYGPRQFGNEDQGWVAHFLISGLMGRPLTIYGNGKQVRDILYVDDLIRAFHAAIDKIDTARGRVYNLGGGPSNTLSLLELIRVMRTEYGFKGEPSFADWRPGDQPLYVSDIRKAGKELGWKPMVTPGEGIGRLHRWIKEHRNLF